MQQQINGKEKLNCIHQINQRLNPINQEQNLNGLLYISDEIQQEVLNRFDYTLKIIKDEKTNQEFIGSEFNRDGDSYRSPFSNEYYPKLQQKSDNYPSKYLRELEIKANKLFDEYRKHYYNGGISSTFIQNKDKEGNFAICLSVIKECQNSKWNSINIVEVKRDLSKNKINFKITTTICISIKTQQHFDGAVAANIQRKKEDTIDNIDDQQIILNKVGTMIEDMETNMRKNIEFIYFAKIQDIISRTRNIGGRNIQVEEWKKQMLQNQLSDKKLQKINK